MKKILIGVVTGALVTAFLFVRFRPQSIPGDPVAVSENPVSNQSSVKIESQGKLFGSISFGNNDENKPNNPAEGDNTPGQNNPLKTPNLTLYDGDKISIPVSGEIKTEYYNSGKQIGAGTHRIDGETILTVGANELQAETIFDNSYRIAVEVPDPPPKLNRIGVYTTLAPGWILGGYYQRNFQLTKNLLLFGRIESDTKTRLCTGLEYQF